MQYITNCPRCGYRSFETLKTYSHCIECLYVEDNFFDLETAYFQVMSIERELESAKIIELPQKLKKQKGEAS